MAQADTMQRHSRPSADREMSDAIRLDEKEPEIVILDDDGGPPVKDAVTAGVADAAQITRERDQERARAEKAERQLAEAGRTVAQSTTDRIADREAKIESDIAAGISARTAALAEFKSAREAGDIEAETAAQGKIADAAADIKIAQQHKNALVQAKAEALANPPTNQRPTASAEAPRYSPEVQAWIDAHPRFSTDKVYQSMAFGAASAAVAAGHAEGSEKYFDYVNKALDRQFPTQQQQRTEDDVGTQPRGGQRPASSTAAPGDRGGGNGRDGFRGGAVDTLLGEVRVSSDGLQFHMTAPVRALMEEGARACKMSLPLYVKDQIAISRERANGGTGGMTSSDQVLK